MIPREGVERLLRARHAVLLLLHLLVIPREGVERFYSEYDRIMKKWESW